MSRPVGMLRRIMVPSPVIVWTEPMRSLSPICGEEEEEKEEEAGR